MARTILSLALLSIIATEAIGQFNQRISLFSGKSCSGSRIDIVEEYVDNLSARGWNDVAQSASVTGGWVLYDHKDFNGEGSAATEYISNKDCTNLQYVDGKVTSLRFAGDKSNYRINSLTLYKSGYFQGDEEFAFQNLPYLNMQQQASFIITGNAGWTFYDQANYQGNSICVYPPTSSSLDPYFVYDMDNLVNIPQNSIRSVKLGCN